MRETSITDFLKKQLDEAVERHKHYRNSGIAFSVSLASVAGALIAWTMSLISKSHADICLLGQMALLAATILFCLAIQFCNYQGYKKEAQEQFQTKEHGKKQVWFEREDEAMYFAIGAFSLGLVLCVVSFFKTI